MTPLQPTHFTSTRRVRSPEGHDMDRAVKLPTQIGRFRIEALLGSGGMGAVYRAVDPTLKRPVAVKIVRPDIDNPGHLARLFREAQACARLQHPNIVTVFEAGEQDGVVFIAMELLKGEDLASALKNGRLSLEGRLQCLGQILDALEHAHAEGVIHRDIKPSNVFVLPDGTTKLVDFGLAHVQVDETVSASLAVMGTPHYASPEQLRGVSVDLRTDIYSTGALAYEMFTGRRPFQGDNDSVGAVVLRVMSDPLPPMNTAWSEMIPDLERLVARAMAKGPATRYQTAAEMRHALNTVMASARAAAALSPGLAVAPDPAVSPVTSPAPGARRSWMGGVAAAILITAAVYTWRSGQDAASESLATEPSRSTTASEQPAGTDAAKTAPEVAPVAAPIGDVSAAPGRTTAGAADRTPGEAGSAPASTPTAAKEPVSMPAAPRFELSARQLFSSSLSASAGSVNAGLRYRLIQNAGAGAEADVDPAATTFHAGDRVRLAFESSIDGHLYVVQEGSSGRWTVLYPNPDINGGRNTIRRGEVVLVPNDDWFLFDATPGAEHLFVYLSREPLTQLPGFDRPVTQLASVRATVVEDLQRSIQSRDLMLEKGPASKSAAGRITQANYVVNRDTVGRTVAATIVLTHAQ